MTHRGKVNNRLVVAPCIVDQFLHRVKHRGRVNDLSTATAAVDSDDGNAENTNMPSGGWGGALPLRNLIAM